MKLVEGQLVHHRYRLDRRLAQGGMGEVWKGFDIQLGRIVAVKALRTDTSNVEAKLRRLRAEAHNSANLAHPNIAALFDYYEHDGIGFLIMEYVPSKSLADLYHKEKTVEPTRLLPILIQTARGLFVAHSHGVIHRDVKPANIMVSETGSVKITDFGVSYSSDQEQITQDGMVVGTAQYISPEQAQGEQATAQSDIYSLGVVAYEGLCGHRPFTGTTPVDIAAAHVNDPVPPLPDSVDLQLRQFVMSMLSKNPKDRPKDALVVSKVLAKIERRLLDQQTAFNNKNTIDSYEGLCGHRPFTGTTPVDIAAAHVNDPVPPLPDSVDLQLRQFVMSMLSKNPKDRPKDALVVSKVLAKIERRLLDQQTAFNNKNTIDSSNAQRIKRSVRSVPKTQVNIINILNNNDRKEQQ